MVLRDRTEQADDFSSRFAPASAPSRPCREDSDPVGKRSACAGRNLSALRFHPPSSPCLPSRSYWWTPPKSKKSRPHGALRFSRVIVLS